MKLLFSVIFFSILVLMHLSSCEGKASSLNSKTNQVENASLNIDLTELTYIPFKEDQCNCHLASDIKNYKKQNYIFVNDEIVSAYVNINGVLTKFIMLDYTYLTPQTSIANYKANGFTLSIEMQHYNKKHQRKKKIGKITLKTEGGRSVVKTFYGECSIKNRKIN